MTCADHATTVEGCVGCAGRWDRAMAETVLAGMYGIEAATLRVAIAEIEALRCSDLDAFFHHELSGDRAAAFRVHVGTCAKCDAGLHELMQVARIVHSPPIDPTRRR